MAPEPGGRERPAFCGYAAEMSETGVFIQTANPRGKGTVIKLLLHLPGLADPLCCNAEVCWSRKLGGSRGPSAGMGLRLLDASEEARSFLREFCSR